ncbi:MAG: type I restriction endonuclease [Polyangiales bacterium]
MTEDQLEQEALSWLVECGYRHVCGYDIAPDGLSPERERFQQVLLLGRLREAIARLNPQVPLVAREDALQQVLNLDVPVQLSANRAFHSLLVNGVPVEYQSGGETRGDFVRLIDFADEAANEFLAVNQFSIKGPKHTRRPDIILFVNGLPLVLLELKNPADTHADIWKAYDQIETYKEQIPDVFQYNEILVISDGSEARMGSLSANAERFMQWRTVDGATLDPFGPLGELETNSVSPAKRAANARCGAVERSRRGSQRVRAKTTRCPIGAPTEDACSTDRRWMSYPPRYNDRSSWRERHEDLDRLIRAAHFVSAHRLCLGPMRTQQPLPQ